MSEGLEKLRKIGAQKIHEQTHIAHKYVQALLHESFEGMQKVQLLGFISILEREYDVDLTPLKERALEYFNTLEESLQSEEASYKQELFKESQPDSNKKKLYIILGIGVAIALVIAYFSMYEKNASPHDKREYKVVSKKQESNITKISEEINQTKEIKKSQDANISVTAKELKQKKRAVPHTLVIAPRSKVWFGFIDLDSGKKRQKTFSQPFELNASKNYLFTFGHGYIDIIIDNKKISYKDPKSIKFLYKNGKLQKISDDTFKHYNKGKLW